jgi:hypothetical protein
LDKVGEGSGEREGKFGNVSIPPQPTHKDKFASKPNQPREKPSEKASEKPSEKRSEKPCEEPHPKRNPRSIHFHCEFCGKDGHKRAFCFKRKREERMAKEWANKDKYHPSDGVLEPRVQLPRAKASVRTVGLGESERLLEVLLVGLHRSDRCGHQSDRCRPGQAAVWVSCSYRC